MDLNRIKKLAGILNESASLDEKSSSEKQARFMAAAAHNPKFAKKAGISQDVAKEFNKADTGSKQLSNAMKKENTDEAYVDICNQDNPASARDACSMSEDKEYNRSVKSLLNATKNVYNNLINGKDFDDENYEDMIEISDHLVDDKSPLLRKIKSCIMDFYEEYRTKHPKDINPLSLKMAIKLLQEYALTRESVDENNFPLDDEVWNEEMEQLVDEYENLIFYSTKNPSIVHNQFIRDLRNSGKDDEFIKRFESAIEQNKKAYNNFSIDEDINNGYNDRHVADEPGTYPDFGFPDGADSPVVSKLGINAKQGDNPEQKSVKVEEDIHKELVYKYRNYLKESGAILDLKKKLNEDHGSSLSVKLEDVPGDAVVQDDSISYNGDIIVSGQAFDKNNNPVKIHYDINVNSSCQIKWEKSDTPTSWNHRRDEPNYTSHLVADRGNIKVSSVNFGADNIITINGNDLSPSEAQQVLNPQSIQQIMNPATYSSILGPYFDRYLDNLESPEDY